MMSSSSSTSPAVMRNTRNSSSRYNSSSPVSPFYNADGLQDSNCGDSNNSNNSSGSSGRMTAMTPSSSAVINRHDSGSCNSCHQYSSTNNDSECVDKGPLDDNDDDHHHQDNNNKKNSSSTGNNDVAIDDDNDDNDDDDDDYTHGETERLIDVDDKLNQKEAGRHSNLYHMMSTSCFSMQSLSPIDAMKLGEVTTLFLFCITILVTSTCTNLTHTTTIYLVLQYLSHQLY